MAKSKPAKVKPPASSKASGKSSTGKTRKSTGKRMGKGPGGLPMEYGS